MTFHWWWVLTIPLAPMVFTVVRFLIVAVVCIGSGMIIAVGDFVLDIWYRLTEGK